MRISYWRSDVCSSDLGTTYGALIMSPVKSIANLGSRVRNGISGLGAFMRLTAAILARSGVALRRPGLVSQQVHFIGNYSLLIIAVSGLFVGFVLGLQGYYTLNRYGSEEALGLLVALSRSEEHTSELQSLMRISYAVFCLYKQ